MSAPHGRPQGRKQLTGAAPRRTVIPPFLGEGVGERVVQ